MECRLNQISQLHIGIQVSMSTEKSLKEQNTPVVIIFIIWCLAIYLVFLSSPNNIWDKLQSVFDQINTKDGIFIVLSPIIALILTGIVSSENKARLAFFRIKNALPGHRVFSDLIKNDARIDINRLVKKLGNLPQSPKDQNSVWYSLYKRYTQSVIVKDAHKKFLLSRELCSISFLFAIVGPIGLYFANQSLKLVLLYFFIMILHYFILAVVTQTHGNRFVCNVVAEYSIDKK